MFETGQTDIFKPSYIRTDRRRTNAGNHLILALTVLGLAVFIFMNIFTIVCDSVTFY
jgi:hypothetical protein